MATVKVNYSQKTLRLKVPKSITAPNNTTTRQQHVALIAAAWQKGVESIFETGRRLVAAKADLPHGEFGAMVESDLPFGARTAQMLMAIVSHPVISNTNHGSVLPPCWRTLYELTKLPEPALRQKIEAGEITPKLGRATVAVWRGGKKRPPKGRQSADPPQDERECDTHAAEDNWQRSVADLLGDLISARAYWSKHFGRWQKFAIPTHLATLVAQAVPEWDALVKHVTGTKPQPTIEAIPEKSRERPRLRKARRKPDTTKPATHTPAAQPEITAESARPTVKPDGAKEERRGAVIPLQEASGTWEETPPDQVPRG